MLYLIAFRNLRRNKRRTFITGVTMFVAFVLSSMTMGIEDGTYGFVIDQFTKSNSGHFQILPKDYFEKPSLAKNIRSSEVVISGLRNFIGPKIKGLTPRLETDGLIIVHQNVIGLHIVGVDPNFEVQTTQLMAQMNPQAAITTWPQNGIVLTHDLSEKLKIKNGDPVVLVSQGADGSIANDRFTYIAETKASFSTAYLPLGTAQDFLSAQDQVTRIIGVMKNIEDVDDTVVKISRFEGIKDHVVAHWSVIEEDFYRAMKSDQSAVFLTLGVFLFLAAFGILNTVLMNILERTKEFAIMQALGTRNKQIIFIIVCEQLILSISMSIVGAIVSALLNLYLESHGIPYPKPIEIGGMTLKYLYGHVSFKNLFYPFVIVLSSSTFVSLIPAFRFVRGSLLERLGGR